jgi:acetyltransferase-like isoleucine patch superfamily enzyme
VRDVSKTLLRAIATLAVLPALASYYIRRPLLSADRALEGSSEALGLVPGLFGDYLRRAFLARVLNRCATSATVRFGTLFSKVGARLDDNVYVGPRCHLGFVHLEEDVLLGAGVHVPSGRTTHGTADALQPIRDQPGTPTLVRIGAGTWVGSAAVVMADVGKHCVIGAGAVVTERVPDYSVAAGVPAKVIRSRK